MSTEAVNSASLTWADRIDQIFVKLKWPAALVAISITPLLLWSLLQLCWRVIWNPWALTPFIAGAVIFVFVWNRFLARNSVGRFLITIEHEATHALFAYLTLHKVVGFKASMGQGGEVKYEPGNKNWLITVAPYFFPTASLILFLLAFLLPFPALPWSSFLLGVALGYHVLSTIRETHRDQTDIKELGQLFCWLFLPAANIAVVGILVAFAHDGHAGLQQWYADLFTPFDWLTPTTELTDV